MRFAYTAEQLKTCTSFRTGTNFCCLAVCTDPAAPNRKGLSVCGRRRRAW